jgi:hypothetical protein
MSPRPRCATPQIGRFRGPSALGAHDRIRVRASGQLVTAWATERAPGRRRAAGKDGRRRQDPYALRRGSVSTPLSSRTKSARRFSSRSTLLRVSSPPLHSPRSRSDAPRRSKRIAKSFRPTSSGRQSHHPPRSQSTPTNHPWISALESDSLGRDVEVLGAESQDRSSWVSSHRDGG